MGKMALHLLPKHKIGYYNKINKKKNAINQNYLWLYLHAHLYEISTAAFKILWVSFEKVLKSGQYFTAAGRELKRLAAQSWNVPDSSGILRLIGSLERKHLPCCTVSSLIFLGQCSSNRASCAALSKCQSRRSLIGNQPNLNREFTEFT